MNAWFKKMIKNQQNMKNYLKQDRLEFKNKKTSKMERSLRLLSSTDNFTLNALINLKKYLKSHMTWYSQIKNKVKVKLS